MIKISMTSVRPINFLNGQLLRILVTMSEKKKTTVSRGNSLKYILHRFPIAWIGMDNIGMKIEN